MRARDAILLVILGGGCRESGCANDVAGGASGEDGSGDDDSGGDDGDVVKCDGAIEIAIVADDSQRQLRLDTPALFDVRAVYETGHFTVLESPAITASPATILRVDDDGLLVPVAAGAATVTATACDLEASVEVEIFAGLTPRQEELCTAWHDAIEAATADVQPCFTEPLDEPDCTTEESDHDGAFEALAGCVAEDPDACADEQTALDERFATLATCLSQAKVGDVDCTNALSITREQCAMYVDSECVDVEAAPDVCG